MNILDNVALALGYALLGGASAWAVLILAQYLWRWISR